MTTKEEAKELVRKFETAIAEETMDCDKIIKYSAKQCALICVKNEYKARLKEIDELSNFLPPRVQAKAIIDVGISCKEKKQEIKKL